MPDRYQSARVVHVLTEAGGFADKQAAQAFKRAHSSAILSVEPILFDASVVHDSVGKLAELTGLADVVSPDWPAACAIARVEPTSQAADPCMVLQECSTAMQLKPSALLAVRCGSDGSYIRYQESAASEHSVWHVPAYHISNVADPTGAGNSYCGALAAYLGTCEVQTLDCVFEAVARASAVGACVVQVDGLPAVDERLRQQLTEYAAEIKGRIRKLG